MDFVCTSANKGHPPKTNQSLCINASDAFIAFSSVVGSHAVYLLGSQLQCRPYQSEVGASNE